ncbi:MAG: hypothetical protein P8O03_03310 [Ilumatobacter sp.]|nr:hypothetical protein [bacterium]MDG1265328.1 hypothetical protein [Ilumatobacter sp.]MDG2039045.1 hypothetical protein [Ilumatobacter sp.]
MPESRPRSLLASIIGWLIVALIVYFFFGWIFGAVRVLLRFVAILVVIGALLWLYFRLRSDN